MRIAQEYEKPMTEAAPASLLGSQLAHSWVVERVSEKSLNEQSVRYTITKKKRVMTPASAALERPERSLGNDRRPTTTPTLMMQVVMEASSGDMSLRMIDSAS